MRRITWAGLLLILAGCGGSSGEPQVATVPVKGTLFVDDKPFGPVLLQLSLEPADPKVPVVNGYVKQDGSFELQTYKPGDGAPVGKYKVVLTMDPMQVTNIPVTKPATVDVAKPSGSGPFQLDVKLQSTGEGMTMSPLPMPGQEGGRRGPVGPGGTP